MANGLNIHNQFCIALLNRDTSLRDFYIMTLAAGTYLQAYSGSSDVSILNAALCICDTDNSASLDINEMNTDQCQLVQDWMLGQIISGVYFTMGDSNGDGFIDVQEAMAAFQLLG